MLNDGEPQPGSLPVVQAGNPVKLVENFRMVFASDAPAGVGNRQLPVSIFCMNCALSAFPLSITRMARIAGPFASCKPCGQFAKTTLTQVARGSVRRQFEFASGTHFVFNLRSPLMSNEKSQSSTNTLRAGKRRGVSRRWPGSFRGRVGGVAAIAASPASRYRDGLCDRPSEPASYGRRHPCLCGQRASSLLPSGIIQPGRLRHGPSRAHPFSFEVRMSEDTIPSGLPSQGQTGPNFLKGRHQLPQCPRRVPPRRGFRF